jgi:hypothetical protein
MSIALNAVGAKTNPRRIRQKSKPCTKEISADFSLGGMDRSAEPGNGPKVQSSRKMDAKSWNLCEFATGQIAGGRCNLGNLARGRTDSGLSTAVSLKAAKRKAAIKAPRHSHAIVVGGHFQQRNQIPKLIGSWLNASSSLAVVKPQIRHKPHEPASFRPRLADGCS